MIIIFLAVLTIYLFVRRVHPDDIPQVKGSYSVIPDTVGVPLLSDDKGKKTVVSLKDAITICSGSDVCDGFSYDPNFKTMTIIKMNEELKNTQNIDSYFPH